MVTEPLPPSGLVDRERELALLDARLLSRSPAVWVAAIVGDMGIGKTALLNEALGRATHLGHTVLLCRAERSAAAIPYWGLGELTASLPQDVVARFPKRHRAALEALTGGVRAIDPEMARTIPLAVLFTLRRLLNSVPVVIAIDDVQWFDAASANALEFALRRAQPQRLGFATTVRTDSAGVLDVRLDGLLRQQVTWIHLAPLPEPAMRELIRRTFPAGLPPHLLERLQQDSEGNPLFALEMGRAVMSRSGRRDAIGAPLPVARSLQGVIKRRVSSLSPPARRVLLLASAMGRPRVSTLLAALQLASPTEPVEEQAGVALGEAVEADAVEVEGDRIRFAHPMLRSAVYFSASDEERRRVHRVLAEVSPDSLTRARHLADATTGWDEAVAQALELAAIHAGAARAPAEAAMLAERAVQLTPPRTSSAAVRRLIFAAGHEFTIGEVARASNLLASAFDLCSSDGQRAEVLWRMARARWVDDRAAALDLLHLAREVTTDPVLKARITVDLSWGSFVRGEVAEGSRLGEEAVTLATDIGDEESQAAALVVTAYGQVLGARKIPLARVRGAAKLERTPDPMRIGGSAGEAYAVLLKVAGRLDQSRVELTSLLDSALEAGDESRIPYLLHELSELESWAGSWGRALEHAEQAHERSLRSGSRHMRSAALHDLGLAHAYLGNEQEAVAACDEAAALAGQAGVSLHPLVIEEVLGFLELSRGDFAEAARRFDRSFLDVSARALATRRAPDELEALMLTGDLDRAERLLRSLERTGTRLRHPWIRAVSARCRGFLTAAQGDIESGARQLQRAVELVRRLDEPFDEGRALLVLGACQRRVRQRRESRMNLEMALDIFDRLGARLWSEKTARELARISGRSPSATLSPAEQRVVELVGTGATNREIAAALFLSSKTVESHLSRIYRKLGVRGRTELAVTSHALASPRVRAAR